VKSENSIHQRSRYIFQSGLICLSGTAGSILVGWLFYGNQVWDYRSPAFQFILPGFALSLLITVIQRHTRATFFYYAALVLLFLPFSTNAIQTGQAAAIIRDLIFGLCLIVAVFLNYRRSRARIPVNKVFHDLLSWILAIAAAYVVASLLQIMIHHFGEAMAYFQLETRLGLLTGVGVSAGVTVSSGLLAGRQPVD